MLFFVIKQTTPSHK